MCWLRNPDEEIRRVERAAREGDPLAQRQLLVWRARTGDREATITVVLHELADALTDWATRDGRYILKGETWFRPPGEHPFRKTGYLFSDVSTRPIDDEEKIQVIELRWEAEVAFDSQLLGRLQQEIRDIRLLRSVNQVRVVVSLLIEPPMPGAPARHSMFPEETTVAEAAINYLTCDWLPELIRAGPSFHSGWYEYRGIIPTSHPYRQVLAIIAKYLGVDVIHGSLYRQSGPPDALY